MKKVSNTEVEVTVRISEGQFPKLLKHFQKNLTPVSSQKRFMIRFFKQKVDVREPLDIRYKWTNGQNQLVIKKGALGTLQREEITIDLASQNQLSIL